MQKITLLLCTFLCVATTYAQNSLKILVKNQADQTVLSNVTIMIKGSNLITKTAADGTAGFSNVPNGNQTIIIRNVGFEEQHLNLTFPLTQDKIYEVILTPASDELEEVIVSSTRTSRTIQNTPTRVETIELEEINEKSNMRPANVSMILHESTGIAVQQTSATSANASIRIQGLDGRYTQLLKDGYASFGNFASGLSILEIPPLDLAQVEIIKGPSSTLYGAGAIAGVVNFISRTPREKADFNFILNQSNVGQTNIGAFSMQRKGKLGYSILALTNFQKAYDVDKDDFTELPKTDDFTLHPKLFYYPNEKTTLIIGNAFTKSNRTGGDIFVVNDEADGNHRYFESNKSIRNTSTLDFGYKVNESDLLKVKTSFNYFKRDIAIPDYTFNGINYNAYTDISYLKNISNQSLIFGLNIVYDKFAEQNQIPGLAKNFTTRTAGLYAQQTWDISDRFKLESGIRLDLVNYFNAFYRKNEAFVLPRISALYKINDHWSSRIGGGLGYKTPTLFTEQTETFQYQNLLPLNNVKAEHSYGGTADINYKTAIGEDWLISFNQMFFYTKINNSTILIQDQLGTFHFENTKEPVRSLGFETNAKIIFKEYFKLFAGYTFTDAKANYLPVIQTIRLLPKNKVNLALLYEKESNFKLGLEGYFTDRQYLYNNLQTNSFWEFGFMAEKVFGKISVFINAENFTDTRQSRYKSVVNGSHLNPTFDDIWTHTEGRTFNGGIKLKL
ncbi:TonB-dependent receptor plug domain-containing protein [Pedobacter petrophilus]|uniref:TonB-dependent receptor plug domain-containing protein n=1 Tax=Pedobacter petrophilus TaxID=1908241 RepID=A0A7K0FVD4_9SPHI|nr:TonB-dependent receptor [Pedobacter petrophilus]MRX75563.1 TonB-dependent receptor plug domain-containing protein [Pedobacter petrophilus]